MDNLCNKWEMDQTDLGSFVTEVDDPSNVICICRKPELAKWIASRLNLASDLEQMAYDYATGKTDGEGIVKYVQDGLNKI
jgi:hypothetical protein